MKTVLPTATHLASHRSFTQPKQQEGRRVRQPFLQFHKGVGAGRPPAGHAVFPVGGNTASDSRGFLQPHLGLFQREKGNFDAVTQREVSVHFQPSVFPAGQSRTPLLPLQRANTEEGEEEEETTPSSSLPRIPTARSCVGGPVKVFL